MYSIPNIAGDYGITISDKSYVVVRNILFKSKTEGVEPYFKEKAIGFFGTLDQALIGLRKHYLKDNNNGDLPDGSSETIDEYIARVQKADAEMKLFLSNIAADIQKGIVGLVNVQISDKPSLVDELDAETSL